MANPLADGCACAGCQALRAVIGTDPGLVALYGKKLLYHGWAGKLTPEEKAYRYAHSRLARGASERGRRNPILRAPNPDGSAVSRSAA